MTIDDRIRREWQKPENADLLRKTWKRMAEREGHVPRLPQTLQPHQMAAFVQKCDPETVIRMVKHGGTYKSVAARLGISSARVYKIIKEYRERGGKVR